MKSEVLAGRTVFVHSGTIETEGHTVSHKDKTKHSLVEFDDGTRVRKVWADSALDRFLNAGCSGKYVFVRLFSEYILVGFQAPGERLRVADDGIWNDTAKVTRRVAFWIFAAALIPSFFFVGIPFLALGIFAFFFASKFRDIGRIANELAGSGSIETASPPASQVA
jgi:hypothetical protein